MASRGPTKACQALGEVWGGSELIYWLSPILYPNRMELTLCMWLKGSHCTEIRLCMWLQQGSTSFVHVINNLGTIFMYFLCIAYNFGIAAMFLIITF